MPSITAATLASHVDGSCSFFSHDQSIHTVFRGDAVQAGNYWLKASRIPMGTPTDGGTGSFNYSHKSWKIGSVTRREDGKVLVYLTNSGRGHSWDFYSATLVLDPTDTLFISRGRRW